MKSMHFMRGINARFSATFTLEQKVFLLMLLDTSTKADRIYIKTIETRRRRTKRERNCSDWKHTPAFMTCQWLTKIDFMCNFRFDEHTEIQIKFRTRMSNKFIFTVISSFHLQYVVAVSETKMETNPSYNKCKKC